MSQRAAILVLLAAALTGARGGIVRTLDGHVYEGHVRLGKQGAAVTAAHAPAPVHVALTNLLHATFGTAASSLAVNGRVPEGWTSQDLGDVGLAGSAGGDAGALALAVGAAALGGRMDALHFLHLPFEGDAEIIARVTALEGADGQTQAGLMMRDSLLANARCAALLVGAEGAVTLAHRADFNAKIVLRSEGRAALPVWLKLTRKKNDFAAARSADGKAWVAVGTVHFDPDGDSPRLGLALTTRSNASPGTATFDQLRVTLNGLRGEYFGTGNFTDPQFARVDPLVNFSWGLDGPGRDIGPDHFSVRWTGLVEPKYSQDYTFLYDADNEAELWVDGQLLPAIPYKKERPKDAKTIPLKAGQRYPIKFEYREGAGAASVRLGWSSSSQSRELIPTSRLWCTLEPKAAAAAGPSAERRPAVRAARGVLLRSGTFLAGRVESVDDTCMKIVTPGGKTVTLFTHHVARLFFRSPKKAAAPEPPPGRTGVLFTNGDFFEGEIRELTPRSLKLSSVLYGLRTYYLDNSDIVAWVLADSAPAATPFEVRTADGALLKGRALALEDESLVVTEAALGAWRVPHDWVVELKRNRPANTSPVAPR
jgi:hypothetical protein